MNAHEPAPSPTPVPFTIIDNVTGYENPNAERNRHARERVAYLRALMGGKCQHGPCGYNLHQSPLQFHHVHGNKDKLVRWGYIALEKAMEELKLCVLLCANCHFAHHTGELVLDIVNDSRHESTMSVQP